MTCRDIFLRTRTHTRTHAHTHTHTPYELASLCQSLNLPPVNSKGLIHINTLSIEMYYTSCTV